MSVLIELQEAVAAVAVAAGPSVVGIGSRLRGSGVVIAEGRVLTNAHNLRGPGVTVRFADGRTARGAASVARVVERGAVMGTRIFIVGECDLDLA